MSPLAVSLVSLVAILAVAVLTVAAVARFSGRRFGKRRQHVAALVWAFGLLCIVGHSWGTSQPG